MSTVRSVASARLPEGQSKQREVEAMFDRIAPGYDRMNRIISLGQDGRWRRQAVAALGLAPGARVLDVGCGTGDLCRALARAGHVPVGVDRSAGMLRGAGADQALVRADAEQLPLPDASVDGVISGFVLRNVVDLNALFRACHRALRPGGRFVALETATPAGRVRRAGHSLWANRAVPLLGRLLARDADAYRYLPQSAAYLPPTGALLDGLRQAGFVDVGHSTMTAGAVQLLTGTRP